MDARDRGDDSIQKLINSIVLTLSDILVLRNWSHIVVASPYLRIIYDNKLLKLTLLSSTLMRRC